MQALLPHPCFRQSARSLDRARLGKQRVEAKQILLALTEGDGWQHTPAVRMWRGSESALAEYGWWICNEWIARGYRDSLSEWFDVQRDWIPRLPPWLGDPAFHRSHQSNLIRKLPDHYRPQFPNVPDNLPYIWPDPAAYQQL